MLNQGVSHLSDPIRHEGALSVNIDRMPCRAPIDLRDVRVEGELHSELRLSNPRFATELSDLTNCNSASQHLVDLSAKGDHWGQESFSLKELKGGLTCCGRSANPVI